MRFLPKARHLLLCIVACCCIHTSGQQQHTHVQQGIQHTHVHRFLGDHGVLDHETARDVLSTDQIREIRRQWLQENRDISQLNSLLDRDVRGLIREHSNVLDRRGTGIDGSPWDAGDLIGGQRRLGLDRLGGRDVLGGRNVGIDGQITAGDILGRPRGIGFGDRRGGGGVTIDSIDLGGADRPGAFGNRITGIRDRGVDLTGRIPRDRQRGGVQDILGGRRREGLDRLRSRNRGGRLDGLDGIRSRNRGSRRGGIDRTRSRNRGGRRDGLGRIRSRNVVGRRDSGDRYGKRNRVSNKNRRRRRRRRRRRGLTGAIRSIVRSVF